jgi:hypothetical protein
LIWRVVSLALSLVLATVAPEMLPRGAGTPRPFVRRPIAAAGAVAPQSLGRDCRAHAYAGGAAENAASLSRAQWSAFGRRESGWRVYVPLTAHEIDTRCSPEAEGFAAALARWQATHHQKPSGAMDEPTLRALDLVWLGRRPFVAATASRGCPAPTPAAQLAWSRSEEGYHGPVQLRPAALAAYRAMVRAARSSSSVIAADRRLLAIFSGYRDPASDAARCATALDCGTPARARCSAHRTGLAMDIYLGSAPGYSPDSSADANRTFQADSAAYQWMVANAARFGFVNYPFEPWHWEWTGETPDDGGRQKALTVAAIR